MAGGPGLCGDSGTSAAGYRQCRRTGLSAKSKNKIPAATGQCAAGLEDCLGPLSPLSHSEAPSSISLLLHPLSRVSLSVSRPEGVFRQYAGFCRCRIGSYRLRQGQCTGWRGYVKREADFGGKNAQKTVPGRSAGKTAVFWGHWESSGGLLNPITQGNGVCSGDLPATVGEVAQSENFAGNFPPLG